MKLNESKVRLPSKESVDEVLKIMDAQNVDGRIRETFGKLGNAFLSGQLREPMSSDKLEALLVDSIVEITNDKNYKFNAKLSGEVFPLVKRLIPKLVGKIGKKEEK